MTILAPSPRVVLFDLDGTLLDSAPDLAFAANLLRVRRALPPLPLAQLRPHVGSGARGMIAQALGITPEHTQFDDLKEEFLNDYATHKGQRSRRFAEVDALLGALATRGVRWGIVTNKHARFAQPIVAADALLCGAGVLICGDTCEHAKPHPAPLLAAAAALSVAPEHCIYVGDDLRDMQAARAAGMGSMAAAWGYLGTDVGVQDWGADVILHNPLKLLEII